MGNTFLRVALWAGLVGSLVTPAFSQTVNTPKNSKPQKSAGPASVGNPATKPIPPHLIKECQSYLAPRLGAVKIVGPFYETKFAISRFLPQLAEGRVYVVAAPTINTAWGRVNKKSVGCIWDIRDGAFVFRRWADITEFPKRYWRAPGDPP